VFKLGPSKVRGDFMNFRNRRILLLGSIGLLVCGVVWRRARTQPVFAFRASNHAGTQTASLQFG
jgi:hypothetical protein